MNRRDPSSPSYELDQQTLKEIDNRRARFWIAKAVGSNHVWPLIFSSEEDLDTALQLFDPPKINDVEVTLEPMSCEPGSAFARACRKNKVHLQDLTHVELVNIFEFTEGFKRD